MASSTVEPAGSNQANTGANHEKSKLDASSDSPPVEAGLAKKSYAMVLGKKIENGEVGPSNNSQKQNALPSSKLVEVEANSTMGMGAGASMKHTTMNVKKRDESEKVQKFVRGKYNLKNNSNGWNGNANGRENAKYHDSQSHNRMHNNHNENDSSNSNDIHRNSRNQNGKHENHLKVSHSSNLRRSNSREDLQNQHNNQIDSQENEQQEHEFNGELADDGDFQMVVNKRHSHANSQKLRNAGIIDSGKEKEFKTNNGSRSGRRRNFRDNERRRFPQEDRDSRKRQGERYRDRLPIVPSHQQPPTASRSQLPNSTSSNNNTITNGNVTSSYMNGLSVSSKAGVTNGSVCSEGGASASSIATLESAHSTTNSSSTGGLLLDVVDHSNNQIDHHENISRSRHLSGGSLNGSASNCETDNVNFVEIAQSPEVESNKPRFQPAPPPAVNPWKTRLNNLPASSIIANKIPAPQIVTQQSIKPISASVPPTSVSARPPQPLPQQTEKKSVSKVNGELKGPEKHKTKPIDSDTKRTTSTTATSSSIVTHQSTNNIGNSQSQAAEQSSASTVKKILPTPSKILPELQPQQLKPKEIQQEQRLKSALRPFSVVAKNPTSGLDRNKKLVTGIKEEWPTLQEALVPNPPTVISSTPVVAVARSKSVITMTQEPVNSSRSNIGEEKRETQKSEVIELQEKMKQEKLPSDNWPSISDATTVITDGAKNNVNNVLTNGSLGHNDDTSSESSSAGESDAGGIEEINRKRMDKHGSPSSSDDNDHSIADNELDSEAITGLNSKSKKSKPKWSVLPLDISDTPSSKSRGRRDRNINEREKEQRDKEKENKGKEITINKSKIKVPLYEEDGPVNTEGKVNYVARGRGRASGVRGRGGRGRSNGAHHHQQWNYQNGTETVPSTAPEENFTDYPQEYTTLGVNYPLTEFVMPYVTDFYVTPVAYVAPIPDLPPVQVVNKVKGPPTSDEFGTEEEFIHAILKYFIGYYFSEANLATDKYLKNRMDNEGFLPLDILLTFPKVAMRTQDKEVVIKAILAIPSLELNGESAKATGVRPVNEPLKWILRDEDIPRSSSGVPILPTPTNKMASQTTNGIVSLSGSSTPTIRASTIFPVERFNPNVPEFIPKLKFP